MFRPQTEKKLVLLREEKQTERMTMSTTTEENAINKNEKYIIVRTGDEEEVRIPFHLIPRFPYLDEERDILDFDSPSFVPEDSIIPLRPVTSDVLNLLLRSLEKNENDNKDNIRRTVDDLSTSSSSSANNCLLMSMYHSMSYMKMDSMEIVQDKLLDLVKTKQSREEMEALFPDCHPGMVHFGLMRLNQIIQKQKQQQEHEE